MQRHEASSSGLLDFLLRGSDVTAASFMDTYWQKRHLHVPHDDPSYLQHLFDLHDVEELWTSTLTGSRGGRQATNGGFLIFGSTGVQTARPTSPWYAFANRCSIVVNRGDRFSTRLYELCSQFEDGAAAAPLQVPMACCNVYLTPPGAQSVPRHSDDREVFLLQVFGEKQWTVYNDPVGLPYRDEELGKRAPVEPSLLRSKAQFTVRQGDVLYMPRGVVHEASTAPSSSSLHLTIALQTSDWDRATLLLGALKHMMREPEFRSSRECCDLKALATPRSEAGAEEAERLRGLLKQLAESDRWDAFETAHAPFAARISEMKVQRTQDIEAFHTPTPAPLLLSSLIMWNSMVEVLGIEPVEAVDSEMPCLSYLVHILKKKPQRRPCSGQDGVAVAGGHECGSVESTIVVSDDLLRCVHFLSKYHRGNPCSVRSVPYFDDMGRLCGVLTLMGHQCVIRVT